ncbi:LOG family protein [Candidatus Daviesbacteria bacterium]|nr:LOG family protein [Candidatus Daviesbacteria bacterium]
MQIWKRFGKKLAVKKATTIQYVTIFGYADVSENQRLFKEVFEACKALALAGYTIVNGGGPGTMEAATLGAHEGGGKAIGVSFNPLDMTNFEGVDPNNKVDKLIQKTSYLERTLTLLKEGQVYLIFRGGTGTISEFGMAWGLARLYFGHHKPLILYGNFWKKIIKTFKENMLLRPEELKVFKIVDSPKGVLKAIWEFEREIEKGEHGHHIKVSKGDFSI